MKMLYHIIGLCPQPRMSGAGFCIHLWPAWKEAVARADLNQAKINTAIKNLHRSWLDGCGYDAIFDPDEDPMDGWKREKAGAARVLSKDAHPLYDEHSIRVQSTKDTDARTTVACSVRTMSIQSLRRISSSSFSRSSPTQ